MSGITFRIALCTVKLMLFFFISNSFFDCKLQSLQQSDLCCSTHCPLTHFEPSGSIQTLCYCPAAERTQPTDIHSAWPCLSEKLILAVLVTPPVPGPPARLSMGAGKTSGMAAMPAVPQHTSHRDWGAARDCNRFVEGQCKPKSPGFW